MGASVEPTHAGGIVYRMSRGKPQILLVTARRRPDVWVFPKGHIERDETAEEAAVREVEEESGVSAAIVAPLEDVTFEAGGQKQIVRFFLMRAVRDGSPGEGRRSVWLPPAEARDELSFPTARASLKRALEAMRARALL